MILKKKKPASKAGSTHCPTETTLAELAHQLPWGFHAAHLEGLTIDWLGSTLKLVVRFPMSQRQDVERRAEVTVSGLFFCSIAPPEPGTDGFADVPSEGLWIDGAEGIAKGATGIPPIPSGVFLHHFYVSNWNYRPIHIAGRDASLKWLGEESSRMGSGGALFPGDEVPDP